MVLLFSCIGKHNSLEENDSSGVIVILVVSMYLLSCSTCVHTAIYCPITRSCIYILSVKQWNDYGS